MKKICALGILFTLFSLSSFGQDDGINVNDLVGAENALDYSVPFLTIATDSRAGAMGDVGAATSPDYNSLHWNPAKYAFIESNMGFALSYTPWLSKLVDDINLYNLAFYKRIDNKQTVAATMQYFDLGSIQFTSISGDNIGKHNPYELSVDVAYSRALSESFSAGIAFRYIRSDITGGVATESGETKPGNAVAADVSFYYVNDDVKVMDRDHVWSAGINISNIGTKISYTDIQKDFIPTNLKIGTAFKMNIDDYNSLTLALDLNKLLIPTPPVERDSVFIGYDSDVSVIEGMIQSFYDAPDGWSEELNEIKYSVGAEYWYANQFAVRAGYFHEHQNKGNRKYFTAGAGVKLNVFTIDFSYLLPVKQNNPLEGTMRFTIGLDFQALKLQRKSKRS